MDVGGDAHIAPLGSCEFAEDSRKIGTSFPILADYSIFPVGNRLIYATHGHVYNTAHLPPLCPGDILLHGHTHVPAWEPFGEENLYLNPGSVSIPKNGSARGYLTLEDGVFQWKTLSGGIPYAHAVIWCLFTAKTGFPSNPFDGKPVVCLPVHSPLTL